MNKTIITIALTVMTSASIISSAQANTLVVSGTIFESELGTTFDTWNINMQNAGAFKVNILAFESTSNSSDDASDINGDGEFTYLDADTYFYRNTGNSLVEADFLARCDDIENNCDTLNTETIKLSSLTEAEGKEDGSIHFKRDPAFNVELAAGDYLYLVADYRLSTSEAEEGLNSGDSIRNDELHADYQITFSSDTVNFSVTGNTINVSAVPVPAAVWLFGTALAGLFTRKKLIA